MELIRCGANRFHGNTTLWSDKPNLLGVRRPDYFAGWTSRTNNLEISLQKGPSPSGDGEYDYTIVLHLSDIGKLLQKLAASIDAESYPSVREHLKDRLPDLIKLLACASGVISERETKRESVAKELRDGLESLYRTEGQNPG